MYKNFPWIGNKEFEFTHACGDFIIILIVSYLAKIGYKLTIITGFSWIIISYIIGKYSISNKKTIIRNFYYLIKESSIYLIHFSAFKIFLSPNSTEINIFQIINKYTIFQLLFFLIINNIIFQKNTKKYFLFIGNYKNFNICQNLIKDSNVKISLLKYFEGISLNKNNLKGVVIDNSNDRFDTDKSMYIKNLKKEGFIIYSLIDWAGVALQNYPVDFIDNNDSFISHLTIINKPFQYRLKKASELFISLILLIVTAPIIIVSALLIYLEDKGSIFYTQERDGLYGEKFLIFKLRTMKKNAEEKGIQWSTKNDQRVTKVGSILRKIRIDELPQLVSVIKGDMNLIGPRPERRFFNKVLEKEIPFYNLRHEVKPGISGWAQVNYPYGSSKLESKIKLSFDLYYIKNFSNFLDLLILFKTIRLVLNARGSTTKNV